MTYLADTSFVVRLRRDQDLHPRWLDAARAGLVGLCAPVEAELVRAVGSTRDRDRLREQLRSLFTWHPVPERVLVAGTAQAWGLTVLHVDADFEAIARVAAVRVVRADGS